jgi:hypothetical protein
LLLLSQSHNNAFLLLNVEGRISPPLFRQSTPPDHFE